MPSAIIEQIEGLQKQFQTAGLNLRWVKPRNIHLTLRFLGDIEPERIADVAVAMQSAAHGRHTLELTVQGLGVFPGLRNPRVLWTGLGGETDLLASLQLRLEETLLEIGFPGDNKPFKAHLTIARCKEAVDGRRMMQAMELCGKFAPLPFGAKEMVLIQSDLRPNGPVYTPLERARLA